MQNNNPNQPPLPPSLPANATQQQQQQYRAAMQQQQLAAMQAAARQLQQANGGNQAGSNAQQPNQPQMQQQQPQSQQQPQQQQGAGAGAVSQDHMRMLQQLFQNNPEQLQRFITLSREGKISSEHMAQLRNAITQARPSQQQASQPPLSQPAQAQQVQAPRPPAIQQQSQPQPQPQIQPQQSQQQVPRPTPQQPQPRPTQQAQPGQQGNNQKDFSAIMQQLQQVADPIVKRVRELDVRLQAPIERGGVAAGTPERARLETELREMRSRQKVLGQQYLAAKAQLLQQQGNTQEAQKIIQSLQQQQQHQQAQQQQQQQQQQKQQQQPHQPQPQQQAQQPQQQAPQQQAPQPQQPQQPGASSSAAQQGANGAVNTPPQPQQQAVRPPITQQQPQIAPASNSPAGKGRQSVGPAGSTASPIPGQNVPTSQGQSQDQPQPPAQSLPTASEAMVQRPTGSMGQTSTAIPAQLNVAPSAPEPFPNTTGPRPTLSQGLGVNPLLGTPAILQRPDPISSSSTGPVPGKANVPGQSNNWEEVLGVASRESKSGMGAGSDAKMSNLNGDELANEMANPDFWDSLSSRGTGADSLVNAGNASTAGTVGAAAIGGASDGRLLSKRKVQELVGEIDPNERLEGAVEDMLLEIADEFIESVTQAACRLAKHRKGDRLEVRDVQLHLERNWNLRIPTPGSVPIPPPRIKTATQQSSGNKAGAGGGN